MTKQSMMPRSTEQKVQRIRGVSQWALAWRRLKTNKVAIVGLGIVGIFIVMAAFDRLVALYPPQCLVGLSPSCPSPAYASNAPPSATHPFGTDLAGYDVYSEIVYGSRAAFVIGLGASGLVMLIAISVGLVAGYFGGWIDNVLMRFTEVFLVLPFLLILLVFLRVFFTISPSAQGGLLIVILIIGVFSWPGAARIIRAEALHIREYEFIA